MKKYDTRQRDVLIEFLDHHPDELLSVRQVADTLSQKQISLSAVYRNLSQLEEEGVIRKSVKQGSREAFYQYMGAPACKNHLHMSCTCCGKTFHLAENHTMHLKQALCLEEGFQLDILNTVLLGVCEDCRKERTP